MNEKKIIVGLDVGTTKICTVIASLSEKLESKIIGVGTSTGMGLKKGSVVNIDKAVSSIQQSLEEAQLMAGVAVSEATVGVAGGHIDSFNGHGVVAVKKNEIEKEDVDRALDAAKAVVIPGDREILHVIPQEFQVDNVGGIKESHRYAWGAVGSKGSHCDMYCFIIAKSGQMCRRGRSGCGRFYASPHCFVCVGAICRGKRYGHCAGGYWRGNNRYCYMEK